MDKATIFKRISHLCFSTNNIPRIVEFYQKIFDASVVHQFINDKSEVYGVFIKIFENTYLEFFTAESKPAGNYRHFCIEVSDLNLLSDYLKARGLNVQIIRSRSDKTLQTWIEDIDGNRIEFHQYDAQSAIQAVSN